MLVDQLTGMARPPMGGTLESSPDSVEVLMQGVVHPSSEHLLAQSVISAHSVASAEKPKLCDYAGFAEELRGSPSPSTLGPMARKLRRA